MGYFDGLVSGSFKKDAVGQTLFFPHGIFGGGRQAPSEAAAQSLKTGLKVFYMIALPVIIVASVLGGFLISMAAAAGLILIYEIWVHTQVSAWKATAVRLSYAESKSNSARALGRGTLIALLVVSLVLTVSGAGIAIGMPEARLTGILSTLFFGACTVTFVLMMRSSRA